MIFWIAAALLGWLAASLAVGIVIGRAIALRDKMEGPQKRHLQLVHNAGPVRQRRAVI